MKHDGDLNILGALRVGAGQIGGAAFTLSSYAPNPLLMTGTNNQSFGTNISGSVSLFPFTLPAYVAAAYLGLVVNGTWTTGGTSIFSDSRAYQMALYTQGTSTNYTILSVLTSASFGVSCTYNNSSITMVHPTSTHPGTYSYGTTSSGGLNITSGYTGTYMIQFPVQSIMSPGNYWLALMCTNSTIAFNSGLRLSYIGNLPGSELNASPIGSYSSDASSGTAGTDMIRQIRLGMGQYTTPANLVLPNSVVLSDTSVGVQGTCLPHFVLWSTTPF